MNYNVPCAPIPGFNKTAASQPWGSFNRFEADNTRNLQFLQPPVPDFTEMEFEKKQDDIFSFIEEDAIPYSDDQSNRDFCENFSPSDADFFFAEDLQNENVYENERSQCLKEEEVTEYSSMSTNNGYSFADSQASFINDYSLLDGSFCLENELTNRARDILQHKSAEEKNYIDSVWPHLLSSLKEAYTMHNLPLTNEIVGSLLEELLRGKQAMIGAERLVLDNITRDDMFEISSSRPDEMISMNELNMNNRKEKVAPKGNRNSSNLNHLNENYVSNIFQFAKRNFPEDREVQRMGNARNISAPNFRKLVQPKVDDDIMTRRARARINASGKELVGNIEYWMADGYFDQCADRQKYLANKEKALRDLALSGKY